MTNNQYWVFILFGVGLVLTGCATPMPEATLLSTVTTGELTAYITMTVPLPEKTPTPLLTIPLTPAPSPTPFIHIVARGETMLGIALQYGVTLEDLQAANPSVDPQFLSVGARLIIPLGEEIQAAIPTPTAILLDTSEPVCYKTGDGGAWCFVLVSNNHQVPVENLSAWIGLYDGAGEIVASQVAVGPLNILQPEDAMPLISFFDPPLPVEYIPRGNLLTAVEVQVDDTRYLDWNLNNVVVDITVDSGREARVTGEIIVPSNNSIPGMVWIAAVAYNQHGQVVGIRKIDAASDLMFDLSVYSLDGPIDRVEIIAELRP